MLKKQIEKADSPKGEEIIEEVKTVEEKIEGEIVVNDPQILRPKELPLIVVLPEGASKAQIAYAKILNAYAYQNPEKWAMKKDDRVINGAVVKGLISKLKELKNAPDPIEDSKLKINKSVL